MRTVLTLLLSALWSVYLSPSHASDQGAAVARAEPKSFGTLVEYVATDAPLATKFLRGLGTEYDDAGLRKRLGDRIRNGEAELLESAYLQSLSGERARVGAVHELIYEAEPDPPSPPQGFGPLLPARTVRRLFDFTAPDDWLRTPTHFEMRPIGQSLELTVQTSDAPTILFLAPERVSLDGEFEFGQAPWIAARPKFHTWKTSIPVRPKFGQAKLVSAHPEKVEPLARTVFVFTTVYPLDQHAPRRNAKDGDSVTLFLQVVETDVPLAQKILESECREGSSPPTLRKSIDAALDRKEARTVSSTLMRTKIGQRAKAEPIKEFVFPTEFYPSQFARTGKVWKTIPPTPSCFELRPLGTILEADVALSRGGESIVVEIDLDVVQLDREVTFTGAQPSVMQPIFDSLRLDSKIALKPGEDQVLAMVAPRESPSAKPVSNRRILLLLRAEVE